MAEAALESLERAVQEVEALDAIFGYEDGGFTLHSEGALSEARSATEAAELRQLPNRYFNSSMAFLPTAAPVPCPLAVLLTSSADAVSGRI